MRIRYARLLGMAVGVLGVLSLAVRAADNEPLVDAKTRLAVTGDSITEQKQYSRFIELYLTVSAPQRPEAVMQFGWGGDRAPGFANRMQHDCLAFFKPTLFTTCYGMNDGNYGAYNDGTGKAYREGMERLVKQALDAKANVLVGGPGAVDTATFRKDPKQAATYNQTLAKLTEIAKEIAEKNNLPFADVNKVCIDAMAKAKAELGEDYVVMGGDGVHPGENGQLAMAYAFLSNMGFDGEIGQIAFDAKDNAVTVKGDHDAKTTGKGAVEITSRRWPFCFTGADKGQTTLAMRKFLPFNETLNRFTLVVTGLDMPFADVTWGGVRIRLERAKLEAGVNLAEVFAGRTPFQDRWNQLDQAVRRKQDLETVMIKSLLSPMRDRYQKGDDALKAKLDELWGEIKDVLWQYRVDEVVNAAKPVTHTLTITPSDGQAVVIKADIPAVPEAADYRLAYDLDLNKLRGDTIAYTTDVGVDIGAFKRVAYFLELGEGQEPSRWIWVSMDAFTDNVQLIGVPSFASGAVFHQSLAGLNVKSNVDGIKEGDGMTGWIEFWSSNYSQGNAKNVPNADGGKFDWGDAFAGDGRAAGYGSMQIHNPEAKQVLFAINKWREGGPNNMDLGIGNNPAGNVDYTFDGKSGKYKFKRLRVLVK